jgi:tetratricopeptide (TPR) repeat protein/CHAT domain-containing protein
MHSRASIVLDIFKQEHSLRAGLFEDKHPAATLTHYSHIEVSFTEIEHLCREIVAILNQLSTRKDDLSTLSSLQKAGQLLWEHLLPRQIREKLQDCSLGELLLYIDEELIFVPWELLFDGEDFLCLKFNIGRLVRSKAEPHQVQYRGLPEKIKMLILADPTSDLRGAYQEGLNIKNKFERRHRAVHVDFKSLRVDKLYVKKNLCDYDIVHFAGHCDFDEAHPENSGWILSDGRFNFKSILNMGQAQSMPALVFSNACHSASFGIGSVSPDYQKISYSFASAFLFAGVRHYIGAIRKIEDKASLIFAREFYTQVISAKTLGESMRLARLKLIKEYGRGNLHWANYILYGDPAFVFFQAAFKEPAHKRSLIKAHRKKIIISGIFVFLFSLAVMAASLLPTINPSSMYLYHNCQRESQRGNNQKAINLGERLIKEEPMFLGAYPIIANAYQKMGNKQKALDYYFGYLLSSEKKRNNSHLARAYIKLGWFYHLNGEYAKALDFYNRSLELSRQLRDAPGEATALRKIAVWHIDKNDPDKALELLTKSSRINLEHTGTWESRRNLACDYFDIGLIFANKNDYVTAKEFYKKSLDLFNKLNLTNELSDCYFNLGEICMFQKQYQPALENYLTGLGIDKKQNNRFNFSGDYIMLGELYAEMDQRKQAERYFLDAVNIAKELNNRMDLADAYNNLGVLYKADGKIRKARDSWRLAQEIYKQSDPAQAEQIKDNLLSLGGD